MKLQIKVDDVTGKITDVKFKTFGCGSAIASSSFMTERVRGLSLDEAGQIKNTEIAKELCLPPVKLHCSSKYWKTWDVEIERLVTNQFRLLVLAEDAIKSAIKDYKKKRAAAALPAEDVAAASPAVAAA